MKNTFFSFIKSFHKNCIFGRRTNVLAQMLATRIPKHARVLDIGCGRGDVSSLLMKYVPSLSIRGIDVLEGVDCLIDYTKFDGKSVPLPSSSIDVCLFIDVLHHTTDIPSIFQEAARVTTKTIIIKDHLCENKRDAIILKLMDWVGNRPYNVRLPYTYFSKRQWKNYFTLQGFTIIEWTENIPLYPIPFNKMFGKGLHFIAVLEKEQN